MFPSAPGSAPHRAGADPLLESFSQAAAGAGQSEKGNTMSNVSVTYDEMRSAASQLRTGQENMNTTLTELSSFIQNLVQSGFVTDQASVTYNDQYEQFTTSTRAAVDALEQLAAYLEQAADTLSATDADLSSAINAS